MNAPPQPTPEQERPIIDAVLRWIRGLRAEVTVLDVEHAVAVGSAVGLLALLSRAAQLIIDLMPVATISGTQAFDALPNAARLQARFDIYDPRFAMAVEQTGANDVQGITIETRNAIQRVVSDAYRQGVNPKIVAPTIAETIGLTTRDAAAVSRQFNTMIEYGMTPNNAEQRAEKYATTLRNNRAKTIAITETIRAHNTARRAAWLQADQHGLFAGQRVYEEWLSVQTDPGEICFQMNGKTTPLGSDWDGLYPGFVHPRCRCVAVPVFEPSA